MTEYKQVIVIRRDLHMQRGKEIAQGSHASMAFMVDRLDLYGNAQLTDEEFKWATTNQKKVTLQVETEAELIDLHDRALILGLTAKIITDSGKTVFHGVPTKTCLAIGPNDSSAIDLITKNLKLY